MSDEQTLEADPFEPVEAADTDIEIRTMAAVDAALAPALRHMDNLGSASYADIKLALNAVRQALAILVTGPPPLPVVVEEAPEAEAEPLEPADAEVLQSGFETPQIDGAAPVDPEAARREPAVAEDPTA